MDNVSPQYDAIISAMRQIPGPQPDRLPINVMALSCEADFRLRGERRLILFAATEITEGDITARVAVFGLHNGEDASGQVRHAVPPNELVTCQTAVLVRKGEQEGEEFPMLVEVLEVDLECAAGSVISLRPNGITTGFHPVHDTAG